jgi:hypothetical protein
MTPPLGTVACLTIGTADFERDCADHAKVPGDERVWAFSAFGARVFSSESEARGEPQASIQRRGRDSLKAGLPPIHVCSNCLEKRGFRR